MSDVTHQPHDKLFKVVFSDLGEAASFLRLHLPVEIRDMINWPTLHILEGSFIDEEFAERESDVLYHVELHGHTQPVLFYLLFEHQSRVDKWMRRRLLQYVDRIWDESFKLYPAQTELPPVIPVVFYQGESSWNHSTELADLLPEFARTWSFVPHFAHLLIDQSGLNPQMVAGGVRARVMQLLMFAAYHEPIREALALAAQLLADVPETGGINYVRVFIRYLLATQERESVREFVEDIHTYAAKQGAQMMSYAEELIREGEIKGEVKGALKGQIETIEKLLRAGVSWTIVEQATGIDAQKFDDLKHELERLHASSVLVTPLRPEADFIVYTDKEKHG